MRASVRDALTLVELVITIALTTILAVPVGVILSEHLTGALRARDYTVAMSLARYEMERLDSLNNFCHVDLTLVSSPGTLLATTPFSSYPAYEVRRIVNCQTSASNCNCSCSGGCGNASNANNDIKRIEVRVTKSGSTGALASLITYRTKFVLFGS